jgi:hypothetical protein
VMTIPAATPTDLTAVMTIPAATLTRLCFIIDLD